MRRKLIGSVRILESADERVGLGELPAGVAGRDASLACLSERTLLRWSGLCCAGRVDDEGLEVSDGGLELSDSVSGCQQGGCRVVAQCKLCCVHLDLAGCGGGVKSSLENACVRLGVSVVSTSRQACGHHRAGASGRGSSRRWSGETWMSVSSLKIPCCALLSVMCPKNQVRELSSGTVECSLEVV